MKAEDVQAVLAPYKGRHLTVIQLRAAAAEVTEFFRNKGYPIARTLIPEQNVEKGVVRLETVPGQKR
ncbi:MAG: hypothetical protein LBP22_13425 [Deltaproteobacteria bacterium]|nr:hypothetical protein [Deltaproteobacteria bacterium]